ncbi:von Willebrand factor type A domain [Butyrivibrio fibrisolvens 16/4]|nr:von Willebrand factor type A domain [Butyrivibrio fibrisolvens 16/4]
MPHRYFKIFSITIALFLISSYISAANSISCVQYYDSTNTPLFYVTGIEGNVSGVTALVGSNECKDVTNGSLSELNIPIETLILVDNSLSIPESERDKIANIIHLLSRDSFSQNKYMLATFGEQIEQLTSYNSTREELYTSIDDLTYENRDTYIKDVLYEVLTEDWFENDENYRRIVIISDGVDDNSLGVTSSEVLAAIEKSHIPITAVGVQNLKASNDAELEELFSYSRRSLGNSFLLNNTVDGEEVVTTLQEDESIQRFTATIPNTLLDGEERSVQFTFFVNDESQTVNIDGVKCIQQATAPTDELTQGNNSQVTTNLVAKPQHKYLFKIGTFGVTVLGLIVFILLLFVVGVVVALLMYKKKHIL